MKVVTGYSFRCPKCGAQLYSENLDMAAKQVLIGEMIKPCVKCGNINRTNKVEYFKTNKNAYMSFYTANFVFLVARLFSRYSVRYYFFNLTF